VVLHRAAPRRDPPPAGGAAGCRGAAAFALAARISADRFEREIRPAASSGASPLSASRNAAAAARLAGDEHAAHRPALDRALGRAPEGGSGTRRSLQLLAQVGR